MVSKSSEKTGDSGKGEGGILKSAAVAIGEFAGKVTVMAESIVPHAQHAPAKAAAPPVKPGKLAPKHKNRVPRKQKKVMAARARAT